MNGFAFVKYPAELCCPAYKLMEVSHFYHGYISYFLGNNISDC